MIGGWSGKSGGHIAQPQAQNGGTVIGWMGEDSWV